MSPVANPHGALFPFLRSTYSPLSYQLELNCCLCQFAAADLSFRFTDSPCDHGFVRFPFFPLKFNCNFYMVFQPLGPRGNWRWLWPASWTGSCRWRWPSILSATFTSTRPLENSTTSTTCSIRTITKGLFLADGGLRVLLVLRLSSLAMTSLYHQ